MELHTPEAYFEYLGKYSPEDSASIAFLDSCVRIAQLDISKTEDDFLKLASRYGFDSLHQIRIMDSARVFAYREADIAQTIMGFKKMASRYPNTKEAKQALHQAATIAYEDAIKGGSVDSLYAYLQSYTESAWIPYAEEAIDIRSFTSSLQEKKRDKKVTAIATYLKKFPNQYYNEIFNTPVSFLC